MIEIRVPARIGLLGNPSDGFGGRVIACTVDDFAATTRAEPAQAWEFTTPTDHTWQASDPTTIAAALAADELHDGLELLAAAVARLHHHGLAREPHRLSFVSDIPRRAGLSGSSAVIVGAIRALAPDLGTTDVARLALEAEVETLGWAAGPQDRVVQAMGGLVDMRFDRAWDATRYERLDARRLPPMILAWASEPGSHSGQVHAPVRDRWEAGDAEVVAAMRRFAQLAAEGRAGLDHDTAAAVWPGLADEAFGLRQTLWSISDTDLAMVQAIRGVGGGATLAGSGGAVVGHLPDRGLLVDAQRALEAAGARTLVPTIGQSS